MGLLDRIGRKNTPERASQKTEQEQHRELPALLLCVNSEKDPDGTVSVRGIAQGSFEAGQEIRILENGRRPARGSVVSFQSGEEARLELQLGNETLPKSYSVIASRLPIETTREDTEAFELRALAAGYERCREDPAYLEALMAALADASVLTGMVLQKKSTGDSDEIKLENGSAVKIPAIELPGGETALPEFTDKEAFSRWTALEGGTAMVQTLSAAAEQSAQLGDGLILNPFGPDPVWLPNGLLEKLPEHSERREDPSHMEEYRVREDDLRFLPVPEEKQDPEILETLRACGRADRYVEALWWLQMEQNGERSWLCLAEVPRTRAGKTFMKIHKAVSPKLKAGENLDFALKEEAEEYFPEGLEPVYRKGE